MNKCFIFACLKKPVKPKPCEFPLFQPLENGFVFFPMPGMAEPDGLDTAQTTFLFCKRLVLMPFKTYTPGE
jgi:hypothetical protein